ncbi:hypothetical protein TUM4433_05680 [Shewanella schlegeliana]|nr:hypothetical protein TUM4433_05680 [Shewanella schlegeliana]
MSLEIREMWTLNPQDVRFWTKVHILPIINILNCSIDRKSTVNASQILVDRIRNNVRSTVQTDGAKGWCSERLATLLLSLKRQASLTTLVMLDLC